MWTTKEFEARADMLAFIEAIDEYNTSQAPGRRRTIKTEVNKMSTIKIEIDTDNAAFDGSMSGIESARMLRQLADKIDGLPVVKGERVPLRDINGNKVGYYIVTGGE